MKRLGKCILEKVMSNGEEKDASVELCNYSVLSPIKKI